MAPPRVALAETFLLLALRNFFVMSYGTQLAIYIASTFDLPPLHPPDSTACGQRYSLCCLLSTSPAGQRSKAEKSDEGNSRRVTEVSVSLFPCLSRIWWIVIVLHLGKKDNKRALSMGLLRAEKVEPLWTADWQLMNRNDLMAQPGRAPGSCGEKVSLRK